MKNLQTIFTLIILAIIIPKVMAQKANVTGGGNATGLGGTVSYSVGQIAFKSITGSGGSIDQGVQQAFEIAILGTDNFPAIVLQMQVYPNPTTAIVNLIIGTKELENINYQLSDRAGKQILYQKIKSNETQIQMENLPQGIYFLNVFENNKSLKTFKIIKN